VEVVVDELVLVVVLVLVVSELHFQVEQN